MSTSLSHGLFIVAWLVAIASWFYLLRELGALFHFHPSTFSLGPKILKDKYDLRTAPTSSERASPNSRLRFVRPSGETNHGSYMFLDETTMLFRAKMPILFRTPFPVKGCAHIMGTTLIVEGRIPIGSTVFFGAIVLGLSSATLGWFEKADLRGFATGASVCAIIVGLSVPLELHRVRRALREIVGALQWDLV